ncbi:AMP-binding protein, partial [Streptomyces sp. SID10244]|nr:AMP-binding protein [Streptomyces sp. SID10244]
ATILKTPYTFDVSVPELFAPFMIGARVIVARPGGHADPAYLAALVAMHGIAAVDFVPSMLAAFLDVVDDEQLAAMTGLHHLYIAGEALPPALARAARERLPHVALHNLYG